MAEAPPPCAFETAATLSDWLTGAPSTSVTDWVLVIAALVSAAGALAVQISDTPRDPAARCRRVHTRPPPDTVRNWLFAPSPGVGPSDATSATRTVGPVVVMSARRARGLFEDARGHQAGR